MSIKLPKENDLVMMCRQIAFVDHYQKYLNYKRVDDSSNFQKWTVNA
jgi:hypothetical protein